jgi:hypothetical protein
MEAFLLRAAQVIRRAMTNAVDFDIMACYGRKARAEALKIGSRTPSGPVALRRGIHSPIGAED